MLGYDVVAVAAGLAGMRAVVVAKDNQTNVIVITKANLVKSLSHVAQNVINTVLTDRDDNWTKSWF
mgnify:CR=1 FL=1